MLDDDDRVALDRQFSQDARECGRVAWVEADGRFVEDVERADQAGAELIGQSCPLGLSSRECAGLAGESQIAEAHAEEKAEFGRQLPEQVAGDLFFIGREGEGCDPGGSGFDCQFRQLMNIHARDFHVACVRSEASPLTAWAGDRSSVAAEHHAHMEFVALPFQVFEELLYALHLALSLPEHLLDILRQVFVGGGKVCPAPLHGEQHLLLPPIAAGFAPGFDGALG